jgi:predicted acetyltransferase
MNKIQLIKLTKNYSRAILDNNKGNVLDFFIPFKNIHEVEIWVDENIKKAESGEKQEFVITDEISEEFLGMIAIDDLKSENGVVRLWIKPESQQKGNAKKALLDLISLYPNKKLTYSADKVNTGSNKLAISCGFKFVREFEDEGEILNEYTLM